jgi:hypothetical protein
MARRSGMYKSEKRRKELKRKKKQDEKRQKRVTTPLQGEDGELSPDMQQDLSADTPAQEATVEDAPATDEDVAPVTED